MKIDTPSGGGLGGIAGEDVGRLGGNRKRRLSRGSSSDYACKMGAANIRGALPVCRSCAPHGCVLWNRTGPQKGGGPAPHKRDHLNRVNRNVCRCACNVSVLRYI